MSISRLLTSIKHSTSRSQGFLQIPNYVHTRLYHFRPGSLHLQRDSSIFGRKFSEMFTRQVTTYSVHPEKMWLKPDLLLTNSNNTRELVDGNDLVPLIENEMCWVIPEKIDAQRFRNALQKALTVFPTFAGRMRKSDNGYQILYSGPGLPVQFAQIDVVAHPAAEATEDNVSQDSSTMEQFLDVNSFTSLTLEDDTPLATLKLTYLTKTGQTVIGLSSNQSIADAPTVKLFMHAISQLYQGLEPLNKPMYSMHKWVAEESKGTTVNHIPSSMTPEDVNQRIWGGDTKGCSLLQMSFTRGEVNALKMRIQQEINNKAPRTSSQDAVVAYLANLYNKFVDEPITTVRFVLTYRLKETDESNRYRDMNNAGNGIYMVDVPIEGVSGLVEKASAFRKAIISSREHHNLEALISARSASGFEMMRNGQIMPCSGPGILLANGIQNVDFVENVSFGCPGRVQAYYSTFYPRYLTLTKPNPVQLADGTWKRNENDVVAAMPVPRYVKEKILQQKARDMQCLLQATEHVDQYWSWWGAGIATSTVV
ncbi:hypothetical protein BDP27DRAFT_1327360 [Rhodocollybia butyracea]|uniref:Uncharacterized protein n=1 Tax=Rhodocollybia butyracea TaxID=206335 RepID=A0A9P5U742_9AGAR|nr:hypothetical protein BDP27DRAFT_1327360 [Rhodocollybia butyracea]